MFPLLTLRKQMLFGIFLCFNRINWKQIRFKSFAHDYFYENGVPKKSDLFTVILWNIFWRFYRYPTSSSNDTWHSQWCIYQPFPLLFAWMLALGTIPLWGGSGVPWNLSRVWWFYCFSTLDLLLSFADGGGGWPFTWKTSC